MIFFIIKNLKQYIKIININYSSKVCLPAGTVYFIFPIKNLYSFIIKVCIFAYQNGYSLKILFMLLAGVDTIYISSVKVKNNINLIYFI